MFAEVKTENKRYILCPHCHSTKELFYIDHLVENARQGSNPTTFGGWRCMICSHVFEGKVFGDGVVDITSCLEDPDPYVPSLVLLKMDPSDKPLYLILSKRSTASALVKEVELPGTSSLAYFYNEHTCPTNWTRDIARIIHDGDNDPHGLFQLVTAMPVSNLDDEAQRRFGVSGYSDLNYGQKIEIQSYAFHLMESRKQT